MDTASELAKLTERLDNWMQGIKEHREVEAEFRDKILSYVDTINNRCLLRTADYEQFNQHIRNHKQEKAVLSSRTFKIGMAAWGFVQALIFLLFGYWLKH